MSSGRSPYSEKATSFLVELSAWAVTCFPCIFHPLFFLKGKWHFSESNPPNLLYFLHKKKIKNQETDCFFYNLKLYVWDRHYSKNHNTCFLSFVLLPVLGKCFFYFSRTNTSGRFIIDLPVSYLVSQRYKLLSGVFGVDLHEGKLSYM